MKCCQQRSQIDSRFGHAFADVVNRRRALYGPALQGAIENSSGLNRQLSGFHSPHMATASTQGQRIGDHTAFHMAGAVNGCRLYIAENLPGFANIENLTGKRTFESPFQNDPAMTLHTPGEAASGTATSRLIYGKPDVLLDKSTHYCPGCGHGIVHRLLAEVMTELDLPAHTIAVAPVGCAVFAYDYLNVDFVEAPHGRAPAVATGIRRVRPEAFVLTYQGDGDLAAIGTAEIVHAAARGERITAIFVNNGIYGMTGGQMAPTTLLGQRTTSSPNGRDAALMGFPIRITEMLATLPGVTYAARGSVADVPAIGRLKAMIKRACQVQIDGGGFALVEALSNCPVGWGMTPQESLEHLKGPVVDAYPLGVIVDRGATVTPAADTGCPAPAHPDA